MNTHNKLSAQPPNRHAPSSQDQPLAYLTRRLCQRGPTIIALAWFLATWAQAAAAIEDPQRGFTPQRARDVTLGGEDLNVGAEFVPIPTLQSTDPNHGMKFVMSAAEVQKTIVVSDPVAPAVEGMVVHASANPAQVGEAQPSVLAGKGTGSEPLPAQVCAAWESEGFQTGWMSQNSLGYRYLVFRKGSAEGKKGEVPAFSRKPWEAGLLAKLPQPEKDFGLYLFQSGIDDLGLNELAGLKQLQTLDIGNTQVTDAGLKELAGLKQLERLSLYALYNVSDAGLKELSGLTQLQTLNLGHARVTDTGLKELAGFKQLHTLDLTSTKVTDVGLKELAALEQLQFVFLNGTKVTDAGLKELAKLKQLHELFLFNTQVTGVGLNELADLKQLQELYLSDKVTDAGLKELAGLKQRTQLSLFKAQVTDTGLKELAGLKQLNYLILSNTQVTDGGLKELAGLHQLQMLFLEDTQVTDAGLKELTSLKNLSALRLVRTKVTDAGVASLQKALPKCSIVRVEVRSELE